MYASDLNPIACMLTWGAFRIVGGLPKNRASLESQQRELVDTVQNEIDQLGDIHQLQFQFQLVTSHTGKLKYVFY